MSETMLYKYPGTQEIHGDLFDYVIVDDEQIDATLADGWSLTTPDAKLAHVAKVTAELAAKEEAAELAASSALADANKPPTRAELEQMATSLSLPFDGRTSDRKLAALIAAQSTQGE